MFVRDSVRCSFDVRSNDYDIVRTTMVAGAVSAVFAVPPFVVVPKPFVWTTTDTSFAVRRRFRRRSPLCLSRSCGRLRDIVRRFPPPFSAVVFAAVRRYCHQKRWAAMGCNGTCVCVCVCVCVCAVHDCVWTVCGLCVCVCVFIRLE